jgi:hypothetical protein
MDESSQLMYGGCNLYVLSTGLIKIADFLDKVPQKLAIYIVLCPRELEFTYCRYL